MTKLYKLTTAEGKTRPGCKNECQWGEGVSHNGTGEGGLCGPGWVHAYEHPLLAVLMNPIHANYQNPQLWGCDGEIGKRDGELKVGCQTLRTIQKISIPQITLEFRVRFAIRVALVVCQEPNFVRWANNWLSGKDRTANTADAAARAAYTANVAYAAARAANAAYAAALAADAADAALAARAASYAALATDAAYAAYAANAAARAANAAYAANAADAALAARAARAARAAYTANAAYAAAEAVEPFILKIAIQTAQELGITWQE